MTVRAGTLAIAIAVMGMWAPRTAQAQAFFDVRLGAASGGLVTNAATTVSGSVGYFARYFGVDGDYSYSRNIGPATTSPPGLSTTTLNLRTVSFNMLGGPTVGPQGKWRPYGALGIGWLGGVAKFEDIFILSTSHDENDLAMNFGGGVIGFFNRRYGLRVDLRCFRDLRVGGDDPASKGYFVRFGAGLAVQF